MILQIKGGKVLHYSEEFASYWSYYKGSMLSVDNAKAWESSHYM